MNETRGTMDRRTANGGLAGVLGPDSARIGGMGWVSPSKPPVYIVLVHRDKKTDSVDHIVPHSFESISAATEYIEKLNSPGVAGGSIYKLGNPPHSTSMQVLSLVAEGKRTSIAWRYYSV